MNFASWLQEELDRRGWGQSDLLRHIEMAGYTLSSAQLSNVLKEGRQAGPDTCIAIAHGLGVAREVIFQARGWLLTEPESSVGPGTPPGVARITRRLERLPDETRHEAEVAINALLDAVYAIGRVEEQA